MGASNLGKVAMTPRGDWSAAITTYEYLDTVSYVTTSGLASFMVSIKTGYVPAGTLPTNTAYFQQLAAAGGRGLKGWQPIYANVADGSRAVQRLVGYSGGEGTAPTENIGLYVGATGLVAAIASALDIRGPVADTSGLATAATVFERTLIPAYNKTVANYTALQQPGVANTIIIDGFPIQFTGILQTITFASLTGTQYKFFTYTKNTTGTGFTKVKETALFTVPAQTTNTIVLNLQVTAGEYIGMQSNGNVYVIASTRNFYQTTDGFATSTTNTQYELAIGYTVGRDNTAVTNELVAQGNSSKISTINTLIDVGQFTFNSNGIAESTGGNVSAASYLILTPMAKSGVVSRINVPSATGTTTRIIEVELDMYNRYVYKRSWNVPVGDNDVSALGMQVTAGMYYGIIATSILGSAAIQLKWSGTNSVSGWGMLPIAMPTYTAGEILVGNGSSYGGAVLGLEITVNVVPEKAQVRPPTHVTVFKDDFAENRGCWNFPAGSWIFDSITKTVTSNGLTNNNYLHLNRVYHNDKRVLRLRFIPDANTIIHFTGGTGAFSVGESHFEINGVTNLMKIYNGAGAATVLASVPIVLVPGREYVYEAEKDDVTAKVRLFDTVTGAKYEVTYSGWAAGRQNDYYVFYVESGKVVMSDLNIIMLYRPYLTIAGDSITEGTGPSNPLNNYARQIRGLLPTKVVTISARGGNLVGSITAKFESEYRWTRPKFLSIKIGTNGALNASDVRRFKNLCDVYGINLIMNHIICGAANKQIPNATAQGVYFNGCYFDRATALNNDPIGTGATDGSDLRQDPRFYSDGIHPNDLGTTEMMKRVPIDLPFLFLS